MSLTRNFAFNLAGYLVPTLLALGTVPVYLHLIGPARYGVLALAWLILGYFGLFDLGLGRAATQRIAALRHDTPHARAVALDTAIATNVVIGLAGALILLPVAWVLFSRSIDMDPQIRAEAVASTPFLALAVPVATTMGVLSGALMGREKFLETNRISITSTALFQILPLCVAWLFGPNLPLLMAASIASRGIGVVMLWLACRREFGAVNGSLWDRGQLMGLLSFGGWVTMTSMFGPLAVFSDRFMIGALIGAAAVTTYVVPMEATRRISGLANSLATTAFPRLAVATGEEARRLVAASIGALYAVTTPAIVGGMFIMEPLMRAWLGTAIGLQVTPLARIFLVNYWINSLAQVPFGVLNAKGRPDIVGKLMLGETVVYVIVMWFALKYFGLAGGAWTMTIRSIIDMLLLSYFAYQRLDYARTLLATLAVLIALAVGFDRVGPHDFYHGFLWGTPAGALALVPAYLLAPRQIIDRILGLLRLRGAAARSA